ncbi:cytochrome C [Burkholderia contaminans]|nr:diheme cytochrome c [Burkholderia contaminans]AKM43141.1 cytochrome C [Burkholderia contaminans]ELK6462811.1 diheme cytochrome c [Burkholderia contaminans]MCA7882564.1 diheme cytochrome c [Burkholderia contaminans]RQT02260.1 cytochrome C [Burkholderia contaminans]RQT10284.1 cytochrome C [Burkholderia contaminans]
MNDGDTTTNLRRIVPARYVRASLLTMLLISLLPRAALAEDETRSVAIPLLPKYRQECATCHVAYPPGALPAESWRRILNGLDRHFGTDATLDPTSIGQLETWLTANAATGAAARRPPEDRITRSAWFIATHDEVPASVWRNPAVKRPSNCAACHTQADKGNFDERFVRIPGTR